ncbi:hypothetical protein ACEPPN_015366 [Leptodophora sp. 'Broadleaf-Isolate-01']
MPRQSFSSSTATSSRRITGHGTSRKKRRLEKLERMTGSASASPPEMHAKHHQGQKESLQNYKRSPEIIHRQLSPRLLQNQYTQPREGILIFGHPPYTQQAYHPISTAGGQFGDYFVPVPVMPGTVYLQGAIKHDDTMRPFNMNYPEIDHTYPGYEDSNPRASTTLSQCYDFNSH